MTRPQPPRRGPFEPAPPKDDRTARERYRHALGVVRQARRGVALPKVPAHAVLRVAAAIEAGGRIVPSKYGSPGGRYYGIVLPKGTKANLRTNVQPDAKAVKRKDRIRRVPTEEAQAIIRRPARVEGQDIGGDVALLYWVPPEVLVVCTSAKQIEDLVRSGRVQPVWTAVAGRQVLRGGRVM